MVDYLTFLDLWSGTLKLKIAFRPEGGSLIVIVVKSWNAQGDVAPLELVGLGSSSSMDSFAS